MSCSKELGDLSIRTMGLYTSVRLSARYGGNMSEQGGGVPVIDVQVDEARKLAALQMDVNRRFVGAPKDISIWSRLCDEVRARAAEIGFVVKMGMSVDANGNWIPTCDIVGRTDRRLEEILSKEGPDVERKAFDSRRVSSSELEREGVDTSLLG